MNLHAFLSFRVLGRWDRQVDIVVGVASRAMTATAARVFQCMTAVMQALTMRLLLTNISSYNYISVNSTA